MTTGRRRSLARTLGPVRAAGRAATTALLVIAASTVLTLAPASAEAPFDVPSQVTDDAGVLGTDAPAVQDALDAAFNATGYQLFVVYVDSFDGTDGETWADQTATVSGLGAQDLLLAVAVDDRRYGVSVDVESGLSTSDVDAVDDAARAALRDEDWSGAAIAAAQALQDVAGPGGGGGAGWLWAGAALLALVAGALVWRAVRRRGARPRDASSEDLTTASTEDLERRAGAALVAIDDAVRTCEQELGFAQAEFGLEATRSFAAVLEDAKARATAVFALRAGLDTDPPTPEPQRRVALVEVVERCDAIADALDEQTAEFDALRALQARAPETLDAVEQRAAEVERRLGPARSQVETLAVTYPAQALASVAPNPDQAARLLAQVADAVRQGRERLATKDRAGAATLARGAENALGQAVVLLDAVDTARADLEAAVTGLDRAIGSITSDVADAERLAATGPAVRTAVSEAEAALAQARAAREGGDPIAALRRVTAAEAALDDALAPSREAAEQAVRARALLTDTLGRAESQLRATQDYVATRRGAVGPEARAALSEAERHLAEARSLQPVDAAGALARAQEAERLAESAARRAQQDAAGSAGGTGRGPSVGGMVLGGILLDQVLGGGRRGGFGGGYGGAGFGGGRRSTGGRRSAGRPSGGRRGGGRGGRF
ncbi:TLP183/Psb32/MOLO-1 phosphatase superfamily protein [Sediminihabitans luteus]|uniref:TLP183/Psb32/MOLO-1 phosphatase superfamily protein n=1 Tax=Sediminihabitans luteus TaxID=1138585 RepID=A0A2M9CE24_9CELL|nr:TPM domain-containing protein [Sediminihabitans luteus]PJJ70181.1 TLP183/Psb32/MOLO-1 phosphatase superfamily protein [Sediminihabitans luteus]GII97652.1 hypothetical protein Slu03_00300 [Sediminihabitans luteus]